MKINDLTGQVIGAAIEVHKELGPGLLESIYEECLSKEIELRKIPYKRQIAFPISYKGNTISSNLRLDMMIIPEGMSGLIQSVSPD